LPTANKLQIVTANGTPVKIGGLHGDTAIIETRGQRDFKIVAHFT